MKRKRKPTRKELERKVRELLYRLRAARWLLAQPTFVTTEMEKVLNPREKDWRICV